MRNDVSIPPDDADTLDTPLLAEPSRKDVSRAPIPPPDQLKADVQLFNHPNFAPGGAGNFWLLGMIGLMVVGVVIVIFWLLGGLMK